MKKHFTLISLRGFLFVSALASCGAISAADSGAVEFHVKPGGVEPFTSTDPSVRPQLGRPGKPKWATGGMEPGYWLSGGTIASEVLLTAVYW